MNKTLEYAFYGAIFGSAFPVVSTFFDLWVQSLPFTLSNALLIQRAQPLHWVIDSAPLFLGLFAAMIGKRQEAVAAKVRELTEVNKHLQSEYRDRVAAEQRAQEALEAEQNAHRLLQNEQTTLKTLTTGLQQLFDDMPLGAAAFSENDELLSFNPAFESFVDGYPDYQKVLNQNLARHSDVTATQEIKIGSAGKEKYALTWRVDLPGLNEARYWILLSDLTEHKIREAQLITASKLATLGELAAGTAHELNQPLNHINLVAANIRSMLRKLPADTENLQAKLTAISDSVGRAAKIIDHMRSFGRDTPQALEAASIPIALGGALTLLENELKNKDIRTEINVPSNLPPIRAVESQIEQVFLNIMGNAIDAICDAAPSRRVLAVEGGYDGVAVNVLVRDTGGGMSDTQLEKLFDPFFTTKEVGKGTGLGGSISYGIVTGFGGTINASNWDQGAEIAVSFPAFHGE